MVNDLKLAWRRLRNSPGFGLVAVITLALAVGANAAIFTVADAVLFRPLPYEEPERLSVVRSLDRATGRRSSAVPFPYVDAIRQRHSGVAAVALRSTTGFMLVTDSEGAQEVASLVAAPDYFQVLGVRPIRGRLFGAADVAEGYRRVMLTYESWRTRFGGDESIIGRDVYIGMLNRAIVGVLPPGFIFPSESLSYLDARTGHAEFVTVAEPPAPGADPKKRNSIIRGGIAVDAVVRLRPGVTREQAQAELDVLCASIRPPRPADVNRSVVFDDVRSVLFPTGRQALIMLLVAAGCVLLVGCANLANMLIARAYRRDRDLAIHAALGASRVRLMRPLFFETLIIGAAAAILAILVTSIASDALIREVPPVAYGRAFIGVNLRVAAFSLTLGLLAGLLFALVPAWRSSQMDVQTLIRTRNRVRRHRRGFGRPMIAVQVSLAIVLVSGAVTTAREFLTVLNEPLGFVPDDLIAVRVGLFADDAALRDFYDGAVTTLGQRGDVLSAGAASSRPFDNGNAAETAVVRNHGVPVVHVLPGYLETLRVQTVEGGLPPSHDAGTDLEPAVLTRSAARMLYPGRPSVGQTMPLERGRLARIIGVIEDVSGVDDVTGVSAGPAVAYVVPRELGRVSTIVVRTRTRDARTFTDVRRQIVTLVPPTVVVKAAWIGESMGALSAYRDPRFQTLLLGSFATLGLGLAALGIFGTVGATVAMRTREMGVRIAIGAPPRALVRLVVRDACVPIAAGIVVGVAATRLVSRVAEARIAGLDPASLGSTCLAIAAVGVAGLLAAYLPARRASRVDPIVVLRSE